MRDGRQEIPQTIPRETGEDRSHVAERESGSAYLLDRPRRENTVAKTRYQGEVVYGNGEILS